MIVLSRLEEASDVSQVSKVDDAAAINAKFILEGKEPPLSKWHKSN